MRRSALGLAAARSILAVLALAAAALTLTAAAADWPQYRGLERDGHSPERGVARAWPSGGPPVLWRQSLGEGYSGIAVADGRVYTLYGRGGDELALCLDAATGEEVWRFRLGANRRDGQGGGPRSTPTVAGRQVFVLGASGHLYALDAATGTKRWGHDLVEEFGARIPQWGASTSPLVEDGLVLVDVGGRRGHSLMAFEAATGKVRWARGDDKAGYSSPLAVTAAGVRQVLFFTGTALVSIDPATGGELWRYPWRTSYDVNAAMPVFVPPDRVFLSSGYGVGAALLEITRGEDGVGYREVWRSRVMQNHFNSSVLVGDHLYGFDNAILTCVDARTGEQRWQERGGFSKGSLLYADGHLFILGERGTLALAEATPEGYREKARAQVLEGKTWTMPTLADGRLFVRSESELVALRMTGGGAAGR